MRACLHCGSTWFVYPLQFEEDGQEVARDRMTIACVRCGCVYERVRGQQILGSTVSGFVVIQDGLRNLFDDSPNEEEDLTV